jgi:hypothetical protein
MGENSSTTIIDGNGSYYAVSINARDNAVLQGFTVKSSYYGVSATDCNNLVISDCIITNCTESGIFGSSSNQLVIINCTLYGNGGGVYLQYFCGGKIIGTKLYANDLIGLLVDRVNGLEITGCEFYNNTSAANFIGTSLLSVCSTIFNNNDDGVYVSISNDFYFSKCVIDNNTDDGLEIANSAGVVSSCNITNNSKGEFVSSSEVKNRFCSISDNSISGILNWGGIIDSVDCWWGDVSGPYHYSTNPSGTGNSVDDNVSYIPWQTSIYQPDILLSDLRCRVLRNRVNGTVYVPTGNIYDDSTFYAFYAIKEHPQLASAPTQSSSMDWLNPDGSPKFQGDIVTFGGRAANRMVAYYEDAGIAKLGFQANGTHRIFKRLSDDYHVYAAPTAGYNKTEKDYFQFQVYMDGDRTVLSLWGFGAEGTYAGGVCFLDVILPQLATYTDSYYVFSWTDLNGDAKPQPNEIQQEAQGS